MQGFGVWGLRAVWMPEEVEVWVSVLGLGFEVWVEGFRVWGLDAGGSGGAGLGRV